MTGAMQYLIMPHDPLGGSGHLHGVGSSRERLKWQVANTISGQVPIPVLYTAPFTDRGDLRDLHAIGDTTLVSEKLRQCVEPFLSDFEFLPAEIELSAPLPENSTDGQSVDNGGGAIVGGYWWLNTWRRLDIVDWSNSTFTPAHPPPRVQYADSPVLARSWTKLALKSPVPGNEHLYALLGFLPRNLFVSDFLRKEIRKRGLRVDFIVRMMDARDAYAAPGIALKLNQT